MYQYIVFYCFGRSCFGFCPMSYNGEPMWEREWIIILLISMRNNISCLVNLRMATYQILWLDVSVDYLAIHQPFMKKEYIVSSIHMYQGYKQQLVHATHVHQCHLHLYTQSWCMYISYVWRKVPLCDTSLFLSLH